MLTQDTSKPYLLNNDLLFQYAETLGFGEIHFKIDHATGLRAIIAIHSNARGPAIGGCRCITYDSVDNALEDALRLAHMMSYKAAACNLPHGGAKAVIMRPKDIKDRVAFFEAFGRFVHELQGRYITAVDSGTSATDMDIIERVTPYVTAGTRSGGDPAPYTALGVVRGIEAAVRFKLDKSDLKGVHIVIQGAGHVGYNLAKQLTARGARITQCDVQAENLARCVNELQVTTVAADDVYDVPCDVFAPCALGAIINNDTIPRLQTHIVAGSANNQLAHRQHGVMLHERNILYIPDFIINSGGLIHAAAVYDHGDMDRAQQQIEGLYDTLWHIFERSKADSRATSDIAEEVALERLNIAKDIAV
jgi:leucine dehydrogenase